MKRALESIALEKEQCSRIARTRKEFVYSTSTRIIIVVKTTWVVHSRKTKLLPTCFLTENLAKKTVQVKDETRVFKAT